MNNLFKNNSNWEEHIGNNNSVKNKQINNCDNDLITESMSNQCRVNYVISADKSLSGSDTNWPLPNLNLHRSKSHRQFNYKPQNYSNSNTQIKNQFNNKKCNSVANIEILDQWKDFSKSHLDNGNIKFKKINKTFDIIIIFNKKNTIFYVKNLFNLK